MNKKDNVDNKVAVSASPSIDLFDGGIGETRSEKPEQKRKFVVKVTLNNEPENLAKDNPISQIFNSVFNQK